MDIGLGNADWRASPRARRTAPDNRAVARTGADPRKAHISFAEAEPQAMAEQAQTWRRGTASKSPRPVPLSTAAPAVLAERAGHPAASRSAPARAAALQDDGAGRAETRAEQRHRPGLPFELQGLGAPRVRRRGSVGVRAGARRGIEDAGRLTCASCEGASRRCASRGAGCLAAARTRAAAVVELRGVAASRRACAGWRTCSATSRVASASASPRKDPRERGWRSIGREKSPARRSRRAAGALLPERAEPEPA